MTDVWLFILNVGWLGGGEWRLGIALGDTMLMWIPTYLDNQHSYLWQPMHWASHRGPQSASTRLVSSLFFVHTFIL
jgi:hypothetical protein